MKVTFIGPGRVPPHNTALGGGGLAPRDTVFLISNQQSIFYVWACDVMSHSANVGKPSSARLCVCCVDVVPQCW